MNKNLWLYRYAILTAAWAVFVIVAGAFVTTTGTGDAVPDWPRSFGTFFPPMKGGIFYEHGHRLAAGGVGLLVLGLALWLTLAKAPRAVTRLGWVAFGAVVLQGVLGGLRVLVISHPGYQRLGMAVTGASHADEARASFAIAHALLAQVCLCVVFAIAARLSPRWLTTEVVAGQKTVRGGFLMGAVLMVMVMAQLLFGAMMRHSGSGLIIPDFPTSLGQAVPRLSSLHDDVLRYAEEYDTAIVDRTAYGLNTLDRLTQGELLYKVGCAYAHRTWAFLILVLLLVNAYRTIRDGQTPRHLQRLAIALGLLGLAQVTLGTLVILTRKSVDLTVLHVATGATILGLATLYTLGWSAVRAHVRANAPANAEAVVLA